MPVDPYQDCPCGSGKKFKWCCQKVSKYAERATELLEKDQVAGAMAALDEGLAIEPTNLWLRLVKAEILLATHDHDHGYPLLDAILAEKPDHLGARELRLQDLLAHGDAAKAAAALQDIFEVVPVERIDEMLGWIGNTGHMLAETGHLAAALAHFRFGATREPARDQFATVLAQLERTGDASPWLKDELELRPLPAGASAVAAPWRDGIELAAVARWRSAAATFEAITTQQPDLAAAWFNLGLCRAWIADDETAAAALCKYAEREPDSEAALHGETLAQALDPRPSAQTFDIVAIRYAIRDRSRLIQQLRDHPRFQVHYLDAQENPDDPGVRDEFYVLDKPAIKDAAVMDAITIDALPAIVGHTRLFDKEAVLSFDEPAADDPRPAALVDAAGDSIDSAGQREVFGTIPVSLARQRRLWAMPSGTGAVASYRVRRMVHRQLYHEVWPNSPHGCLQNLTPREAATKPELKRSLRAAVLLIEFANEIGRYEPNLDELRSPLGLEPEPTFDGAELDVDGLPLGRLRQVRAESLSTPRLKSFFERAARFAMPRALANGANAIVARPADRDQFNTVVAFKVLITHEAGGFDRQAAADWLARARQFDRDAGLKEPQPTWDVSDWELSMTVDPPATWVPQLNELMGKYRENREVSGQIMAILVRLGLVQIYQDPRDPNRPVMDTRMLEGLMRRYGTRQPGGIDLSPVAASGAGRIWTPDADRPTSTQVWAPGQQPPPAADSAERPKIWTPGS